MWVKGQDDVKVVVRTGSVGAIDDIEVVDEKKGEGTMGEKRVEEENAGDETMEDIGEPHADEGEDEGEGKAEEMDELPESRIRFTSVLEVGISLR